MTPIEGDEMSDTTEPRVIDVSGYVIRPNFTDAPNWMALQAWLADDYERRVVSIDMRAESPDYSDDGEGTIISQSFSYEIKATEIGVYASEDLSASTDGMACTVWEHRGYGGTLDDAARTVLAMMAEHDDEVGKVTELRRQVADAILGPVRAIVDEIRSGRDS